MNNCLFRKITQLQNNELKVSGWGTNYANRLEIVEFLLADSKVPSSYTHSSQQSLLLY